MLPMIENQQLSKAINETNSLKHVPYKKRKLGKFCFSFFIYSYILIKICIFQSDDHSLNTTTSSKPDSPTSSPASPTGSQDEFTSLNTTETSKTDDGQKSFDTNDSTFADISNEKEKEEKKDDEDYLPAIMPIEERKLSTLIAIGTPVPKERKKLPGLEKWAVGMGELLHFENLPDSVGAYESKIKGLIEKIREKQKIGENSTSSVSNETTQ